MPALDSSPLNRKPSFQEFLAANAFLFNSRIPKPKPTPSGGHAEPRHVPVSARLWNAGRALAEPILACASPDGISVALGEAIDSPAFADYAKAARELRSRLAVRPVGPTPAILGARLVLFGKTAADLLMRADLYSAALAGAVATNKAFKPLPPDADVVMAHRRVLTSFDVPQAFKQRHLESLAASAGAIAFNYAVAQGRWLEHSLAEELARLTLRGIIAALENVEFIAPGSVQQMFLSRQIDFQAEREDLERTRSWMHEICKNAAAAGDDVYFPDGDPE